MANPIPGTMIVDAPQADPWEEAFGAYRQALIDLNGDGIPDAVIPANRERQAISKRAMAGREPTLSPMERSRLAERIPQHEANNQAFEQGMGELLLGQPVRSANSLMKLYNDPSLATLTNAGVQTAGVVPTARGALAAAGIGGAGLGAAVASDLMLPGDATANGPKRNQPAPATGPAANLPGLTPEQNKEYNDLQGLMQKGAFGSGAQRRQIEGRARELRALSDDFAKNRNVSGQKEYDDAVRRAETARDTILADKPRKFSDTKTGKVFDELGMVAPALTGGLGGGLAASGARAAGLGHKAATMTGMGVGGVTGGLTANWPLGHEIMFGRAGNSEKQAIEAYVRELPPDHPRKAEWADYARNLPDANPERTQAVNELLNIPLTAKRSAFAVGEGILAGWAGADLPGAIGRLTGRGRGSGTGNTPEPTTGPGGQGPAGGGPAQPQNFRTYPDLPPETRQGVQSRYISDRALTGNEPPVGRTAQQLRSDLSAEGINVPVTPARISETNKVISNFVAQYGRLPTAQEFSRVFTNKTLAIPLAGAAAAGPMNNLMSLYGQTNGQTY